MLVHIAGFYFDIEDLELLAPTGPLSKVNPALSLSDLMSVCGKANDSADIYLKGGLHITFV